MFNGEAKLDTISGRSGWWQLAKRLVYTGYTVNDDGGKVIIRVVIPEGFETNLASTPRILWPILPPFGSYTRAVILHDYLYRILRDRFLADALMRSVMREEGTCWIVRVVMFYAVRLFGGIAKRRSQKR